MAYQAAFPEDDDDDRRSDEQAERFAEEDAENEVEALRQEALALRATRGWAREFQQSLLRDKLAAAIRRFEKNMRPPCEQADKARLYVGRLLRLAKPDLRGAAWPAWLEEEVGIGLEEAENLSRRPLRW